MLLRITVTFSMFRPIRDEMTYPDTFLFTNIKSLTGLKLNRILLTNIKSLTRLKQKNSSVGTKYL